jgi:hypothetical protein
MRPMRNLVVAPAGDRSIHREWMGDPRTRSYDVWLNGYDADAGARFAGDPVEIHDARGTMKWPGVGRLLSAREADLARYGAVWFPDDDVSIDTAGVERMFALVHELGLWLAQPSLDPRSYFSHPVTLTNRSFVVRYTNFVEVMAPVFSREALERCRPTFGESVSGWGLDRVWPRVLGDPRDRVGILDAVPMIHTRPVGGGTWYASLPASPLEEEARIAARYGLVPPFRIRQYGGVPAGAAARREAAIPAGAGFLWRVARGAPRSQWTSGRFWRRHWRSVRAVPGEGAQAGAR